MMSRWPEGSRSRVRALSPLLQFSTVLWCILLCACSVAPTHPALRDMNLPPLLPVRTFVTDIDYSGGYRISPDGRRLSWTQVAGTRIGLATRHIDGAPNEHRFETGQIASWGSVGIACNWLADSRHLMYVKDPRGDENTHIFVVDTDAVDGTDGTDGALHDLTPWPGARSLYVAQATPDSARFFFQSNRRDAAAFDLYEADAGQLTVHEVLRGDATLVTWIVDIDGTPGGRIRVDGPAAGNDRLLEIIDPATGQWRLVRRFGAFGFLAPLRLDRAAGKLVANSGIGRDTTALVEIDLATGYERELFRDPRVDLSASYVQLGATTPYAVQADPGYPEVSYFDAALERELRTAVAAELDKFDKRDERSEPLIAIGAGTADRQLARIIVRPLTARGEREYLFDRPTRRLTLLKDLRGDAATLRAMVPVEPIEFPARDGMMVRGFLLRPAGARGRRLPLVVAIHGGPWLRDYWAPAEPNNDFAGSQLLANRGYAVLHVNYRGSTGYGGKFMYAAVRELAGQTQQDIEDAVQWAIDQGIADPGHVGLIGDSFGGFSVLSQMTQSPQRYACGVDIVGIAGWLRWLDEKPPYWHNAMHWWTLFLGVADPPSVKERERLHRESPLSRIDAIHVPLLVVHGANDVRVARQDSDEVVATLRALGRPVDYLLFPDEGHAIRKWQNRLRMWRAIEDFYAACLGGRSSGFDAYQLLPQATGFTG